MMQRMVAEGQLSLGKSGNVPVLATIVGSKKGQVPSEYRVVTQDFDE